MTFTQYLRTKKKDQNGVGDFARDWIARGGVGKPRGYKTFAPVERFLEREGACDACIEAARRAFNDWQSMSKS